MTVVRGADCRRTTTPAGTMTTFASPTVGGAASALWKVEMAPGAEGPMHAIDAEQIWAVVDGAASVHVADESYMVAAGDTVIIPADAHRQIHADPTRGFVAVVAGPAAARARVGAGDSVVPPWIA